MIHVFGDSYCDPCSGHLEQSKRWYNNLGEPTFIYGLAGSSIDPHDDLITEYYECLIECDEDQHICKRICKEVLVS